MKNHLLAFLFGLLSSIYACAAEPLPVKGVIVFFDGRGIRSNAAAYEYSTLSQSGGAFKATLSDGRSVSGLSGQILVEISYQTANLPALIGRIEAVSRDFTKAGLLLAPRLEQLRTLAQNRPAPDTPPPAAAPTVRPTLSGTQSLSTSRQTVPAAASLPVSPAQPISEDEATKRRRLLATFNDPKADSESRVNAILELAMSPQQDDAALFGKAARDPLKAIRKWGYRGLGKIKSSAVFPEFVALASQPALDPADLVEIVKQFGRIAASTQEETSIPALRQLTTLLGSPDSNPSVKEQAKAELAGCAENGQPWVRTHIASVTAPDVAALNQQFLAADEVRKKAIALELSMRFTPEDNAALLAYAYGKTLPPRPLEGIPGPVKIEGRITKLTADLASEKEKVARGNNISILDGPRSGMIEMYQHELAALKSNDTLRIARVTLGRLAYITGKNVQNGQFRDMADSIASTPSPTYVDYQNGQQVGGSYHMAGDVLGGLVAGAAASYMNAKYKANAAEAAEIVKMLKSLSDGAKKKLGIL
jgi:hypothetical protein